MSSDWSQKFAQHAGDVTSVYESLMVPRVFAPWAEVLLDALAPAPGATVVDVATGPGPVARAAAVRVGAIGRVIGCDLSPGMLAAAARTPVPSGAAPIEWVRCPADALALPDGIADAITCQQGLQFFPDKVAALAQMRRVARPGARLAASVWRPIDQSPAFAALAAGIEAALGAAAAAAYRSGPFGLTDGGALADLAAAAGWRDIAVTPRDLPTEFPSPDSLVTSLAVTPLGAQVDALDESGRRALVAAVADALAGLVDRDGAVRSTTGTHFLLAVA